MTATLAIPGGAGNRIQMMYEAVCSADSEGSLFKTIHIAIEGARKGLRRGRVAF
jgi:hypothetical protein